MPCPTKQEHASICKASSSKPQASIPRAPRCAPPSQRANALPEPGQVVVARRRQWLVEGVKYGGLGESVRVSFVCLGDDDPGRKLDVPHQPTPLTKALELPRELPTLPVPKAFRIQATRGHWAWSPTPPGPDSGASHTAARAACPPRHALRPPPVRCVPDRRRTIATRSRFSLE